MHVNVLESRLSVASIVVGVISTLMTVTVQVEEEAPQVATTCLSPGVLVSAGVQETMYSCPVGWVAIA